jgi:exonuclease-1
MGILGLMPFLKARGLCKPFEAFAENARIAIDVPIFAHKFIYAERTYKALEKRFETFGQSFREKGLEPLFVFDGAKLPLKDNERAKRMRARNSALDRAARAESQALEALLEAGIEIVLPEVSSSPEVFQGLLFPTAKEYTDLQSFLGASGFQTFQAKYEAEALCAHLCATGSAWCTLTEDTDALAFGSPRVVFKYGTENACIVELDKVVCVDVYGDQVVVSGNEVGVVGIRSLFWPIFFLMEVKVDHHVKAVVVHVLRHVSSVYDE